MELQKQGLSSRLKNLFAKIDQDNLFLLASSVSYYSALSIAPFLLILLSVAALIGNQVQFEIITMASEISPEVGTMIRLLFDNINENVNISSASGIAGFVVLFSTASLVFLQMRYALDVIYGYHQIQGKKSIWETILEKLFAMFVVLVAGVFLIVSSSVPGVVRAVLGTQKDVLYVSALLVNIVIYILMFWGIHYFTPTKRPGKTDSLKMATLSSVFFILGNSLLSSYLRGVASSSIFGAAGSLLIFLLWTYYSSFTLFLSVEIFQYLKKIGKLK
jgi:membrane protein